MAVIEPKFVFNTQRPNEYNWAKIVYYDGLKEGVSAFEIEFPRVVKLNSSGCEDTANLISKFNKAIRKSRAGKYHPYGNFSNGLWKTKLSENAKDILKAMICSEIKH